MNKKESAKPSPKNFLRRLRFKQFGSPSPSETQKKKRRNKRARAEGYADGRWTETEHDIFLKLFKVFGNDWKSVRIEFET
jgi:hypothetical protein